MGTSYILQSGYAYSSSRRYPIEPETVMVSEGQGKYIGITIIDDNEYATFRDHAAKRYYFQLAIAVYSSQV